MKQFCLFFFWFCCFLFVLFLYCFCFFFYLFVCLFFRLFLFFVLLLFGDPRAFFNAAVSFVKTDWLCHATLTLLINCLPKDIPSFSVPRIKIVQHVELYRLKVVPNMADPISIKESASTLRCDVILDVQTIVIYDLRLH